MFKNCAPLFFLIITSSVIVLGSYYIKEDIETYANRKNFINVSNENIPVISDNSATMEKDLAASQENVKSEEAGALDKKQELSFIQVTESYFDDALFIGDSRTVGLKKYAMLGNASYYSETGMTIYNLFDKKIQEETISKEKLSLEEVLTQNSYKKIYLMVGINELGRGTADTYFEEYEKVISRIQHLQPNAILFIEGNMNVTKQKSNNDPIFNNVNISQRNQKIASLEDKKTIFYIDINDVITDEEGYLIADYTFDDIHLKAKYYSIWKDFLLKHGVLRE